MQRSIFKFVKSNAFVIFLQTLGLIGLMVNLYLASKQQPLIENDKRLESYIDTVSAKVESNQELTDTKFQFISEQLSDIKQMIREK